jgi:hypothetical protein
MDTQLIVNINGTYQRLDLFQDIPITLTIQQSDLTKLTDRRVPYSKTIEIPDTSDNAILFEHYFEVNGTDFNPLNKVPCVVQYRGTDIFQGILRMNAVNVRGNERTYEIYIIGEVADFASQIRDITLQDLDYTDLNHQQVYSAITQSWEATGDGISGLFGGKILYPMINYGLDYQGETSAATPTFTYSFGEPRSFDQAAFAVPEKMWKPSIQVKDVLNRIFAQTDYELNSEFLDTDYFKSIYMDTFQNGKIGVSIASATTNQNIFLALGNRETYRYFGDTYRELPLFDTFPGGYDPLGNWFNENDGGYFRAPYVGDYSFNLKFGYRVLDLIMLQGNFKIRVFKSTDPNNILGGTQVYESPQYGIAFKTNVQNINLFFNVTLNAGEYIKAYIYQDDPYLTFGFASNQREWEIVPFNDGVIQNRFVEFDLYNSPTLEGELLVNMAQGISDINCFEFLKSLITLFNLIVVQDETTKQVKIEPYNWYYNDTDRVTKDWTQILDTNSQYRIEPLSFDLPKEVIWSYVFTDNEFLPKQWSDQYDYVYGRYKFTTLNNVFVGEEINEIPFGSCPTSGVTGAENFIIPQFYYLNNQQQSPYATLPHLFFWVGNRFAYKDRFKQQEGYWYMYSGNTAVQWNTYPAVSHLSLLDSTLPSIISDLNFQGSFDFFGNSNNQIAQFTPFTLFNTFWADYVTNIYSPETRRLTGKFYFRPIDVYETQLSDKIFIKDANYTIEKITDADLVNKGLTTISLIKDTQPYYKIEPPAPIYALTPNQSYPGFVAPYTVVCFTGNTDTLVCNSTAPLGTLLIFGGGGILQNFSQAWYDTGISISKLPLGTFIKQQNIVNAPTFVVVDNYGRILEYNNC